MPLIRICHHKKKDINIKGINGLMMSKNQQSLLAGIVLAAIFVTAGFSHTLKVANGQTLDTYEAYAQIQLDENSTNTTGLPTMNNSATENTSTTETTSQETTETVSNNASAEGQSGDFMSQISKFFEGIMGGNQ